MSTVKRPKVAKKKAALPKKPAAARPKRPSPQPVAAVAKPAAHVASVSLPNAWQHLRATLRYFRAYWQFYVWFIVVYILLSVLFVHNFASGVADLKNQLSTLVGGNAALTGLSTYAYLVASQGTSSSATTAYQYIVLVLCSLACIWALRHTIGQQAKQLSVRQSFYEGMYPLVPFLLVSVVLVLELLPAAIGGSLLGIVVSNGIVTNVFEQSIAFIIFLAFVAVSVWLLSMSLFALYIVTLAGGRPIQALRDSRTLTKGWRLNIVRKCLFLALVLLIVSAVVLVPAILVWPPLAAIILFLLGALALPFMHAYLFGMYRGLLV